MKLSIFPSANPHPKSAQEKNKEAKKVSAPYLPETVEVNSDEQLIEAITHFAWSPFVFSGARKAENFVSCDFLTYDIDEGLTIDEAQEIVKQNNLCCLCLPSPSHTPEAHRFRLVIPLAKTIFSPEIFAATWRAGADLFRVVDEQCKDLGRFYFSSSLTDGFWEEGEFFTPVEPVPKKRENFHNVSTIDMKEVGQDIEELVTQIYGEKRTKVPEVVDFFIRNAGTGLPGLWVNSLNSFCFSLSLSGVEESVILEACEILAPLPLDSRDLYQVKRAVKDGISARETT